MDWIPTEEWAAFVEGVLPLCTSLEDLWLSGNPALAVDIVELVAKLPPTIKGLDLGETACFGDGTKADWARLTELDMVDLHGTKVTGSEEELKAAGIRKECCVYAA